jgi:putative addiction module killer protein
LTEDSIYCTVSNAIIAGFLWDWSNTETSPKKIIHYETPDRKIPFELWYAGIKDMKIKQAVDKRMDRVEIGNYGDCESVGDGVSELRFKAFGVRIYFADIGGVIVLLLCAGDKATQSKDIANAKNYWYEYRNRAKEVRDYEQ